jgi:hypothetical protein
MRYSGPNNLHSTQRHFGALVRAAGELVPDCSAVASAKNALEIEQLEDAAFDEIAASLA